MVALGVVLGAARVPGVYAAAALTTWGAAAVRAVVSAAVPFASAISGDGSVRTAVMARLLQRAELIDAAALALITFTVVALAARSAAPGSTFRTRLARATLVATAPLAVKAAGLALGLILAGPDALAGQSPFAWLALAAGAAAGALAAARYPHRPRAPGYWD